MDGLLAAMALALMAGLAIPAGGLLARVERIHPDWLERELRHSVIAFGGGALLSAVALVLVPDGMGRVPTWLALASFGGGGLSFFAVDRLIEKSGGSMSQLLAMLLDFVPESMALGALLEVDRAAGILLAVLITLQNLPEGFNAYRELARATPMRPATVLITFGALSLLGPLAAWIGYQFLRDLPEVLGFVMLFASGGILYLLFEDIAPQARLERHWAPPLGAVAGFMLGMLGHALTG